MLLYAYKVHNNSYCSLKLARNDATIKVKKVVAKKLELKEIYKLHRKTRTFHFAQPALLCFVFWRK